MKIPILTKAFSQGLFCSISVGALMAGTIASARAVVYPGTDYLVTPEGGATYYYKLPGGGNLPFNFNGLPIGIPTPNGALFSPTAPPTGGTASQILNPFPPPTALVTPPNPNGSYTGWADTVVNRTALVDPTYVSIDPITGFNTNINPITGFLDIGQATPIEIVGLSLKGGSISIPAELPVPGLTPGTYNLFAGLQKYYGNTTGTGPLSLGTMFIGDDPTNTSSPGAKTWDSEFTLKAMAFGVPVGSTLDVSTADFVRTTLQGMMTPLSDSGPYACKSVVSGIAYDLLCVSVYPFKKFRATNEPWRREPSIFDLVGENLVPQSISASMPTEYYPSEFYLNSTVKHDAGCDPVDSTQNCTVHVVDPKFVPAPLPLLGASTAYAFARRLRKRCREVVKTS
jgi:hypothetical protein